MRFWEASAIVPLLVREGVSAGLDKLIRSDPHVVVWWATEIECVSALRRREREGVLHAPQVQEALARLDDLRRRWDEVQPAADLREQARRLLAVHALRASDALQLAAALRASDPRPAEVPFVCLDRRLVVAGVREGMNVVTVS